MYRLSKRSIENLKGVDPYLISIMVDALSRSRIDFGIIEGVRSIERQEELVGSGKSKTMHSKHLTGHAVDVLAYPSGKASWDIEHYWHIASAVALAAQHHERRVRWGGAWNVPDIAFSRLSGKEMYEDYLDFCKEKSRTPFIDGVHFEIFPLSD